MRVSGYSGSLLVLLVFWTAGCSQQPPPAGQAGGHRHSHSHEEHAHEHGGAPHGGELIELGKEDYHAELVHNEAAGTITIYVLDGSAKKSVAIEAPEIVVNLKLAGKPAQFKLPAYPDKSDPEGKASRFLSSEKELMEGLDAEGADAQLVLEINGTQFSGARHHDHPAKQ